MKTPINAPMLNHRERSASYQPGQPASRRRIRHSVRFAITWVLLLVSAAPGFSQELNRQLCPGDQANYASGLAPFNLGDPGTPLLKRTLLGPNSRCNDGSPGVMYIRRGGVVSYASDLYESGRQAVRMVDKILKGAENSVLATSSAMRVGRTLTSANSAAPEPAVTDCNSLFAARIMQAGVLADCTTATLAAPTGQDCQVGETANDCATRVYDNAEALVLPTAGGPMKGKWLGKCLDGTNSCAPGELRCYDGTRPMIYAGKAVGESGDTMYSNGWVIHMGGEGGPCNGDACWDMYVGTGGKGAEHQKAMSTYHPDFFTAGDKTGQGIMSHKTTHKGDDNNFAHFNRIEFNRCSDGASDTYQVITTPSGTARVFHDGDKIWVGLINYLDSAAGRDLGGGGNSYTNGNPDLPPLQNATHVLLTASSDATHWLVENADRVRALVEAVSPGVVVKIASDGMFGPMLENEARYNANVGTSVFNGPFDNPANELLPPSPVPGAGQAYSAGTYLVGGARRDFWDDRNVQIDPSCDGAHVNNERCYDSLHVLLNHVKTPFFIVADQRDNTVRDGHFYADDTAYEFQLRNYRNRVIDQGHDVVNLYQINSEMAPGGADVDAGPVSWNRGVFLLRPNVAKHVHFSNNDRFFGRKMKKCNGPMTLETISMTQALHRWLINDTGIDAIEDPRIATGIHWVTAGHACGAPL